MTMINKDQFILIFFCFNDDIQKISFLSLYFHLEVGMLFISLKLIIFLIASQTATTLQVPENLKDSILSAIMYKFKYLVFTLPIFIGSPIGYSILLFYTSRMPREMSKGIPLQL